jgi:hypothetical protein
MAYSDVTIVYLTPRAFQKLLELATRATKLHDKGGWQDRLRAWRATLDEKARSVTLSHTNGNGRRLDDMTFIIHAIEQRNVGGWQKAAFDIFAGQHPLFTGLNIKPRPSRR